MEQATEPAVALCSNSCVQRRSADGVGVTPTVDAQAVLAALADGILTLDGEYRVLSQNPAIGRLLGYSLNALQGTAFTALFLDSNVDPAALADSAGAVLMARHVSGAAVRVRVTITAYGSGEERRSVAQLTAVPGEPPSDAASNGLSAGTAPAVHQAVVLQQIATAANAAETTLDALIACVPLVATLGGWPFAQLSRLDAAGAVVASESWCAAGSPAAVDFRRWRAALAPHAVDAVARAFAHGRMTVDTVPASAVTGSPQPATVIALPIVVEGMVCAMFEAYGSTPVTSEHTALLEFFAAQIGHVAAREEAERDTRLALEQISYHMNNSVVGVLQFDAEFRITAWSPSCTDIFGWREQEVLGRSCEEIGFIHADDGFVYDEARRNFLDPAVNSYRLFNRNVTKAGKVVHIDWFNSILRDARGELVSNLSIAVDRTAEVVARQELEDERGLFVSGPMMVFRWRDAPGLPLEYISPNVRKILGYESTDLIGPEPSGWRILHPDDLQLALDEIARFRASGESQWAFPSLRLCTKDGVSIWVDVFTTRSQRGADADVFVAYALDVTHTRELQQESWRRGERLADVIEATDVGTWEWTVDTGELELNDRWLAIAGYLPGELHPLNARRSASLIHPADREELKGVMRRVLADGSGTFEVEFRIRHKGGEWLWVEDHGKVVERDPQGRALRLAGIRMDITRRKSAEQSLIATNEALQRSNVELERFAYVASHDLQEPLRMVASFTQLLQKRYGDQLDETAREYMHFAYDGAHRMQQLIRDLLSYSRLGRQEIEEYPVDMHALAARVLMSMQLVVEESGANVHCHALPVIRGDKSQLFRLLQNLIANAIKYRSERPPEIEIGVRTANGETEFYVADNGIGIDPADGDRVFEIFQRLQRRGEYEGTGIGLSVCKRVVERHGGRIWLESEPGVGTTFLFTFAPDRYKASRVVELNSHSPRSLA